MAEHIPVLLDEVLEWLDPRPGGVYVDATVGAGGHAAAILERIVPAGRLIGLDRDPEALEVARARLERFGPAVVLVHATYDRIREVLAEQEIAEVDGILMDVGISSLQLSDPARGFSFQAAGPLDMRMDRTEPTTAADLVNHLPEADLARILWDYGEERFGRRIARAIVRARPLQTTTDLAQVVERAVPRKAWPRGIHPATRTFQALRIATNRELDILEQAIPNAVEGLRDRGRLCILSFHSLEDRIAKHSFLRLSHSPSGPESSTRSWLRDGRRRPAWPGPAEAADGQAAGPRVRVLTRRPITPSEEEIARNPRARSAKLRVAERLKLDSR